MVKRIVLFILMLLYCSQSFVLAEQEGWLQNGEKVPDSENIKSKNGFGAQFWLTNDQNFLNDWIKPETPNLTLVNTAKRNKPIFTIIIFINPGADENGNANVTCDVLFKKPDGSMYSEFKDVDVWQNKPVPGKNEIQLAAKNLGIVIEDKDPLGKYTVEVLVKDNIKKIELPLYQEFTAEE